MHVIVCLPLSAQSALPAAVPAEASRLSARGGHTGRLADDVQLVRFAGRRLARGRPAIERRGDEECAGAGAVRESRPRAESDQLLRGDGLQHSRRQSHRLRHAALRVESSDDDGGDDVTASRPIGDCLCNVIAGIICVCHGTRVV